MNRRRRKMIKFRKEVSAHKPHIFAAGTLLSAAATSIATAAGVAQFREIFGLGTVMVLATAAFAAAFIGTLLLKKKKLK